MFNSMLGKLGKMKQGMADNVLQLILGIILIIGVAVPITVSVVNNVTPSVTGISATILPYMTVFVVLGALGFVAYSLWPRGN